MTGFVAAMDEDSPGTTVAILVIPFPGRNWSASSFSGSDTASAPFEVQGEQSNSGAIGGGALPLGGPREVPRTCSDVQKERSLGCWYSARTATFLGSSGADLPVETTARTTTYRTSYAFRR